MEQEGIRKIAIIGPESTGKSTLCEQLAAHYQTNWCPEYAREYLTQHGPHYTYDDLLTIARGQVALEDVCINGLNAADASGKDNPPAMLFIDTNMYVMKVWCEFVFGKCHTFILDEIARRPYDLYLLCNIDLPWTSDALREYPDVEIRRVLFHLYKDLLENQNVPWALISGNYEDRFSTAINAIESAF